MGLSPGVCVRTRKGNGPKSSAACHSVLQPGLDHNPKEPHSVPVAMPLRQAVLGGSLSASSKQLAPCGYLSASGYPAGRRQSRAGRMSQTGAAPTRPR